MPLLTPGTPAPDFQAQNLTGPDVSLAALKGQKPIVLVFPPANVDAGRINATKGLYERIKGDVEVLVMQRFVPTVAMAKVFLQQLGVTFPVLLDDTGAVHKLYGVEKPFVTYYIDQAGNIVHASGPEDPGAGTVEAMEQGVKTYLLKGTPPTPQPSPS
ncbi:MAG: hypothetical protein A2Z04_07140 [Chloroflexi bacterium RBG_16_57_9]|nr:MAG: hypothetical protein A2Z04_07140 [Chloroflexi bacterium RBG_16_57_9]